MRVFARLSVPAFLLLGLVLIMTVYLLADQPSLPRRSRRSSSPPPCNATLVTAYYKIPSKHSHAQYSAWMANLLSLRDCMVVWVEPGMEDLVKRLRPPEYPTIIIPRPLEASLTAGILDGAGWGLQETMDRELNVGHSRQLYWVWGEKTNLIKLTKDINPFSTNYFVWLDIGAIRHTRYNHQFMLRHIPVQPGVLLLNIHPFLEDELDVDSLGLSHVDFSSVDRIGGGTIGCDRSTVDLWHSSLYSTMGRYGREGRFLGKDQNVMATVCVEQPGLCLLLDAQSGGNGDPWFRMQQFFRGDHVFTIRNGVFV